MAMSMSAQSWAVWVPRPLRVDLRSLNGMSWERIAWLFAVALGFAVWSTPASFTMEETWSRTTGSDVALSFVNWFVRYLISFAPVLFALTFADNLPFAGAKRVAALIIAIVVGAQVQWPVICAVGPGPYYACDYFPGALWQSWKEMLGATTIFTMLCCAPIALAYFFRRRDLRMAEAVHAAELARVDMQRQRLAADLQTMQARVEPAFLFETLSEIGELFEYDSAAGGRMLDELIGYLRAALPDMRATRSTLQREASLVGAYLAILQIRTRERLIFDVHVDASLQDASVPPMMVLPLVAAAVGGISSDAVAISSVHLDANVVAGRIRIALTGSGPALRAIADASVVRQVRERLQTLYGDRASLSVDGDGGRLNAVLDLPHDSA
jgi:hypothetical protein